MKERKNENREMGEEDRVERIRRERERDRQTDRQTEKER
jgi:hypothetical protein